MKATKIILTLALFLIVSLLFSVDPWGIPAVLTGSMTVMSQVSISGQPAANGDVLAAFVTVNNQEELRGKGIIQVINNVSGCLLLSYTETNGETISFKVWDDSAQQVRSSSQTLLSEINGSIGGWPDSLYQINATVVVPLVEAPTFNPVAGTYPTVQNVAISCNTPDAIIRFTTDNSDPTSSSTIYTAPVSLPLNSSTTIKAKAFKTGWNPSVTATALYTITGTVITPTFSPVAGTYQTAQSIALSCSTDAAAIYYTTNGTDPTNASTLFTGAITLPLNSTTTIKARAYKAGWTESAIATAIYTITGTVATPVMTPVAGTYSTEQSVTIACSTSGAIIYFTTNGTDPTTSSAVYSAPIVLPLGSTTTIKAKAFKTDWTPSIIASGVYIITGTVATPAFNPVAGTYNTAQSVTISCSTSGATIRFTTNGADPTSTSTIYSTPISVPAGSVTTLKAIAYKTDWTPSAIGSAIYTITGTVATPTFSPTAGTYFESQNVTINCNTPDVTIHYTSDGTEPTETSSQYISPIALTTATTLKAKAFKTGWISSYTATSVYTFQVSTLYFTPIAGSYNSPQNVTIVCPTPNVDIYYTMDGTEPTINSTLYTNPINISSDTTLKARAFVADWNPSEIATANYIITGTVATPTFSPVAGTYNTPIDVTIESETPMATIYFTIDGTEPTESSLLYNPDIPINLTESTVIKAKAYRSSWISSSTAVAAYTIVVANDDDVEMSRVPGIISCYPNPFVTGTSIRVLIPVGKHLQDISIYDVKGKVVKRLASSTSKYGIIDLNWNGTSNEGRKVSSGVYFVKCKIDGKVSTKKISIMN